MSAIPHDARVALFVTVLLAVCGWWLWWSLEDRDL